MTDQEIKDNMLIHEWMGNERTEKETGEATYKQGEKGRVIWASQLQYHASWDWLMPVVERMKDAADLLWNTYEDCELLKFKIDVWNNRVSLVDIETGHIPFKQYSKEDGNLIQNVFSITVDFIKWDNSRKK